MMVRRWDGFGSVWCGLVHAALHDAGNLMKNNEN
jgi:hypothetical protein